MSKVENAVEQLIAEILSSDEYLAYDVQRNTVKKYPELKAQIDEFRERRFLIQNSPDGNSMDKMEAFEQEYSDFRENPLVNDFLAAELDFCRMMQQVNLQITEGVHFE